MPFLETKIENKCEINLIRNVTVKDCNYHRTLMNEIFISKINHTWIFSGEPEQLITVQCGSEVRMTKIPENGVLAFSDTCTIKAENFKLEGVEQRELNTSVNLIHMFKWTSITNPDTNRQLEKLLKLPELDDDSDPDLYVPDRKTHYAITLIVTIGWTLVVFWLIRKYLKRRCHSVQVLQIFPQRSRASIPTPTPPVTPQSLSRIPSSTSVDGLPSINEECVNLDPMHLGIVNKPSVKPNTSQTTSELQISEHRVMARLFH